MNFRFYFLITLCSTILSWIIWCLVVYTINPDEAGFLGFLFFYISSGFALFGTSILVCFTALFLRNKRNEKQILDAMKSIFKNSFLISLFMLLVLLLIHKNVLTWWNTIILILLSLILKKTLSSIKIRKNT